MSDEGGGAGDASARGERCQPLGPYAAAPARPGSATVDAVVTELSAVLADGGVALARDEARDIVAALLDVPRFWPSMNRDASLDVECHRAAVAAAHRRAAGSPFAYAVRRAAFRHLSLDVDENVLIPRQETELLVELVLEATGGEGALAVDVGTGSGAIALALATEGHYGRVVATDVSLGALAVARRNVALVSRALRCDVELRSGSLLAPLAGEQRARVIVSNPPYIAYAEAAALPASVRDWEPAVALFAGENGMSATAAIVRDAPGVLESGGLLALEVDTRRASLVAELCMTDPRYREINVHLDLSGRERFVLARRR